MKHLMKSIIYSIVILLLANCKYSVTADGEVVIKDDGEEIVSADSLRYFRGGWFGVAGRANFSIDLTLTALDDGSILANLRTPECTLRGNAEARDVAKLEKMIKNAKTKTSPNMMIDGGDELISLQYGNVLENHYLMNGDSTHNKPVIVEEDAEGIRDQVKGIVESIERQDSCAVPNADDVVAIKIQDKLIEKSELVGRPISMNFPAPPREYFVERELAITLSDNSVRLTGSELKSRLNVQWPEQCYTNYNEKFSDPALVAAAQNLKVTKARVLCLIARPQAWPYSILGLSMSIYHKDGTSASGSAGCEHNFQLQNYQKFMTLLKIQLSKRGRAQCVQSQIQ
mgnify:CR=1 FL=1